MNIDKIKKLLNEIDKEQEELTKQSNLAWEQLRELRNSLIRNKARVETKVDAIRFAIEEEVKNEKNI